MNREISKVYKVAIIGGGMGGLVSSILLSERFGGDGVCLIEKLPRLGKKILSTGNGQCNISNIDLSCGHYHSNNRDFYVPIITKYPYKSLESFFKNLGIPMIEEDGKIYPLSKQANCILDGLRFKVESLKTNVFLNTVAIGIIKENFYKIKCENNVEIYAENVILAVGGKSQRHLGTDGSSYKLATSLNHSLTNLYPSLVQLKVEQSKIKGLKGLKQKANVKAVVGGKVVSEKLGEVLFTDYGLSGNTIFYLSSYLVDKDGELLIDFCVDLSHDEMESLLRAKCENCKYLTYENLLSGFMNSKIATACLRNYGYDVTKNINKKDIKGVVKLVKNYKLKVIGNLGFDNSQVTKGGINTLEFDCETLESKINKGFYAIGEVLDVDGDCGGYNLQWAFSSACAVAYSIK